MLKIKLFFILLFIAPCVSSAQTSPGIDAFTIFVSKKYRLPDELKSNCEWMYAIVKVKTDNHNKIVKYDMVNTPPEGMKKAFGFLTGYQFPQKMKIKGHPIVFYMAINNIDGCTEKPGDKVFYAPNDAGSQIWLYLAKLIKDDPNTIFLPGPLIYEYGKSQP